MFQDFDVQPIGPAAPASTPGKRAKPLTGPPSGPAGFRRRLAERLRDDAGMNTAEYAVGTLAAVAFAGLLLKVLTSETVQTALTGVLDRALS